MVMWEVSLYALKYVYWTHETCSPYISKIIFKRSHLGGSFLPWSPLSFKSHFAHWGKKWSHLEPSHLKLKCLGLNSASSTSDFSSQLLHSMEAEVQVLGPCLSCVRHRLSSDLGYYGLRNKTAYEELLASVWPNSGYCNHLGNEPVTGLSLPISLSPHPPLSLSCLFSPSLPLSFYFSVSVLLCCFLPVFK